ncbi:MAG: hypothetical protein ABL931_06465 [Usitatibacteraceae bacterium]
MLAEDIGEALGCGAYLTALRRTSTGGFSLDRAVTLEGLDAMVPEQRDTQLLPADSLAMALPVAHLDAIATKALQNGQIPSVPASAFSMKPIEGAEFRTYDPRGVFLGVATASDCDSALPKLTALRLMTPETPI